MGQVLTAVVHFKVNTGDAAWTPWGINPRHRQKTAIRAEFLVFTTGVPYFIQCTHNYEACFRKITGENGFSFRCRFRVMANQTRTNTGHKESAFRRYLFQL
jgi:hypothetical protein